MTTSEKVAYLKGLAEGMGVQEDAGQGKLFKVIIDILEDLALDLADTKDSLVEVTDGLEELGDDVAELEDEFYDYLSYDFEDEDEDEELDDEDEEDEDYDGTVFYSLQCPGCGYKLTVSEDILDEEDFECPECGYKIDLTSTELEEIDFEDEDDESED